MKRPSGCLLTVLAIPVALFVFLTTNYARKPPEDYPQTNAIDYANDIRRVEEGFPWHIEQTRPDLMLPICPVSPDHPDGPKKPYISCISITWAPKTVCGVWSREDCVALEGDYSLITQPKAFAKVVDAMIHPCRYLPTPEEWSRSPAANEDEIHWAGENRRNARCESSPERYPGEVILILYDYRKGEEPVERLRIVKPAEWGPHVR